MSFINVRSQKGWSSTPPRNHWNMRRIIKMVLTCRTKSATSTAQTNFVDMASSVCGNDARTSSEFHAHEHLYMLYLMYAGTRLTNCANTVTTCLIASVCMIRLLFMYLEVMTTWLKAGFYSQHWYSNLCLWPSEPHPLRSSFLFR